MAFSESFVYCHVLGLHSPSWL